MSREQGHEPPSDGDESSAKLPLNPRVLPNGRRSASKSPKEKTTIEQCPRADHWISLYSNQRRIPEAFLQAVTKKIERRRLPNQQDPIVLSDSEFFGEMGDSFNKALYEYPIPGEETTVMLSPCDSLPFPQPAHEGD